MKLSGNSSIHYKMCGCVTPLQMSLTGNTAWKQKPWLPFLSKFFEEICLFLEYVQTVLYYSKMEQQNVNWVKFVLLSCSLNFLPDRLFVLVDVSFSSFTADSWRAGCFSGRSFTNTPSKMSPFLKIKMPYRQVNYNINTKQR